MSDDERRVDRAVFDPFQNSHTEATPCGRVCPNRSKKQKRYDQFINADTKTECNLTAANIKSNGWEIPTIPCEYYDRPAGKVPIPTEVNGGGAGSDVALTMYETFRDNEDDCIKVLLEP